MDMSLEFQESYDQRYELMNYQYMKVLKVMRLDEIIKGVSIDRENI